jgi:hypothetical protein
VADRHGFRRVEDLPSARGLPLRALLRSLDIPLLKLPALVAEVLTLLRGRMGEEFEPGRGPWAGHLRSPSRSPDTNRWWASDIQR